MSDLVPDGWENKSFADVITLSYGKSPKEIFADDGIYPVLGTGGITGYTDSYLHEGYTTVVGRKGTINKPSFINGRFWAIDTTYYASNYKATDAKWFFYLLQSLDLTKYNEASGVPSLNRDTLYSIPFVSPSLPEQRKIAAILTSVDEVIEKTQAQIDKLKDLKTAMMQELLTCGVGVDGKPHTEFKDSPVGRIPKRWEVGCCKELCHVVTKGTTPTTLGFKYTESGINFIKVESIISNGVINPNKFSFIDEETNKALSRSVIYDGDILITIAGATVGKLAMVNKNHLPANTNQALAIVRVNINKVERDFLFYWLQSEYIVSSIKCIQTVGAQPNLSLAQIGEFSVPLPSKEEQIKIVSSLESIDKKVSSVKDKLSRQVSLKKALMQDLLTGKVRVTVPASSSLKAS